MTEFAPERPADDEPPLADVRDPRATEHPTGEARAAQNAEDESPA